VTVHLDLSVWELLLGCALFFFAAIGVVLVCFCILVDAFRIRFPLPATAVDTAVAPETPPAPVVHVGEVVLAPQPDLLPPAPVSLAEVPIFSEIPFTLPIATMDFGFTWGPSALTSPTGSYQVIADPELKPARARFATTPPKPKAKRKVSVRVGADVRSELIEVPS
jgi:hypothetical protein